MELVLLLFGGVVGYLIGAYHTMFRTLRIVDEVFDDAERERGLR